MNVLIKVDDLQGTQIAALLEEHIRELNTTSPPESMHALDLAGLRKPGITFWSMWDNSDLLGCCALKQLDLHTAEIKSMRTATAHRRRGLAAHLLQHLIDQARQRGYQRLNLETGSMEYFAAARQLYERFGFTYCAPFADYREDSYSVYMTLAL